MWASPSICYCYTMRCPLRPMLVNLNAVDATQMQQTWIGQQTITAAATQPYLELASSSLAKRIGLLTIFAAVITDASETQFGIQPWLQISSNAPKPSQQVKPLMDNIKEHPRTWTAYNAHTHQRGNSGGLMSLSAARCLRFCLTNASSRLGMSFLVSSCAFLRSCSASNLQNYNVSGSDNCHGKKHPRAQRLTMLSYAVPTSLHDLHVLVIIQTH